MKTSRQIQNYILKNGEKRTNADMAERLNVPRMTFAGVLAAMKRRGDIGYNFLRTDIGEEKFAKRQNKKLKVK